MNSVNLKSGTQFEICDWSFCCSDEDKPWAIFKQDLTAPEQYPDIIEVSIEALEAIHKLTLPSMVGYCVQLPDIHVSLSKWYPVYTLIIEGWGIPFTSWELTEAELALVHEMTSFNNLIMLELEEQERVEKEKAEIKERQAESARITEEQAESLA